MAGVQVGSLVELVSQNSTRGKRLYILVSHLPVILATRFPSPHVQFLFVNVGSKNNGGGKYTIGAVPFAYNTSPQLLFIPSVIELPPAFIKCKQLPPGVDYRKNRQVSMYHKKKYPERRLVENMVP